MDREEFLGRVVGNSVESVIQEMSDCVKSEFAKSGVFTRKQKRAIKLMSFKAIKEHFEEKR